MGLKDDKGNLIDGYFSLTNFPHGLQLTWVANQSRDTSLTSNNGPVTSRDCSRDTLLSRGSDSEETEEINIVLEWVKCVKTLDTLLDQHFLITNNNLQKMVGYPMSFTTFDFNNSQHNILFESSRFSMSIGVGNCSLVICQNLLYDIEKCSKSPLISYSYSFCYFPALISFSQITFSAVRVQ